MSTPDPEEFSKDFFKVRPQDTILGFCDILRQTNFWSLRSFPFCYYWSIHEYITFICNPSTNESFLSLVSLLSLEEKGLLKRANFSSIVRVGHISVSFANTVAPLLPLLCARCIILAVGWLFSKSNFVSFVCFGKLVKIDRYQLSKLWKQNCFSVEAFSTKI